MVDEMVAAHVALLMAEVMSEVAEMTEVVVAGAKRVEGGLEGASEVRAVADEPADVAECSLNTARGFLPPSKLDSPKSMSKSLPVIASRMFKDFSLEAPLDRPL